MSSLTIMQEHDRITFAVDTAKCFGDSNLVKYRYYDDKVQKVHRAGKDMVFIAGMTECTEQVKGVLNSFVNKKRHINIELLKQYLKREFPKEKSKYLDTGLNDIGVDLLSVVNGESFIHEFSQDNDYEPMISKALHNEIKLFVCGFDNERIYKYAMNYVKTLKGFSYRNPETFITIYQNNYSEGVGGYIQVYSLDSEECKMIKEHKLKESNLRYVISENKLRSVVVEDIGTVFSAHISATQIVGGTISGTDITGVKITGGTITGASFYQVGEYGTVSINNGGISATQVTSNYVWAGSLSINGYAPITTANISSQSVNYAVSAGSALSATNAEYAYRSGIADFGVNLLNKTTAKNIWISNNDNLIGSHPTMMYIGSSGSPFAGGYGVSGWTTTSDERLKTNINPLSEDARWLKFIRMIIPYTFQMTQGTSGREHTGFIAQRVEAAMIECGISDMEFAGLVKAPIYAQMLKDDEGNNTDEYDTSSEIIDYKYFLRYEEFIPLICLWLKDLEERNQGA